MLHAALTSPMRATGPAHLILLALITLTILGEEYKPCSSSLCSTNHAAPHYEQFYISRIKCMVLRFLMCVIPQFQIFPLALRFQIYQLKFFRFSEPNGPSWRGELTLCVKAAGERK
jgi:hypothetical protein